MDGVIARDAPFLQREGLSALIDALGADSGQVRLVGGIVRDTLIGIDAADIDLATRHHPEDVLHLLGRAGIKAVPTGIAHGTITAVLPSGPVEVTTLRRDVATDGRHAVVAFTDDWREDAARRDFTMNALYADPLSGEVIDYFGGLGDLAAGRVRFIGDPLQRIGEDHLRILRYFRFHARFGDTPDQEALAACTVRANDLMALSRERIATEVLKLVVARHAPRVIALMVERGIFRPVLPEIGDDAARRLAALAEREAAAAVSPDALRRLCSLIPKDPAVLEHVGARLKLSKAERRRMVSSGENIDLRGPEILAYRIGTALAVDRLLLSDRPIEEVVRAAAFHAPTLPLSGGAFVTRGIDKGPDVARLLKQVEEAWIAEGFPQAGRVEQLADAAVDQLRSSRNA
ncbi:CCA tRNA nucleotidyltransferase [Sphingomonas endolithica]|uniref:CCA tRNA nucleotidyltransferase n=1 Tax=Sphingomonas endolithica TaxID=2972485 RepID=UPI0021AE339F|nr:CCA tRNA nucleotidyltransferase [Sphingomonas sp. ZFBP2030]